MPNVTFDKKTSKMFNRIKLENIDSPLRLTRKRILEYAVNKYIEDNGYKQKVDQCIKKMENNDKYEGRIVMDVDENIKKVIKEIRLTYDTKENCVIYCLLSSLLSQ